MEDIPGEDTADSFWQYIRDATIAPTKDPQFVSLSESSSILEVIVKAHLFIEREITRAIEAAIPSPHFLNLERETFARKLRLMAALNLVLDGFYEPLQALNAARNRLAHDLHAIVDPAALHALIPSGLREIGESDSEEPVAHMVTIAVKLIAACRVGYILAKAGSPHTQQPLAPDWLKDL